MERIRLEVSQEIEDIMPIFLDTVSQNIVSIRDALGRGDLETVRTLGHRMKGAGGGYGFDRVTELGREIEMAARAADAERCRVLNEELAETMSKTDIVFVNKPL
jgi:HPt (histidine-containing phosphotransfer) domain-containing protein